MPESHVLGKLLKEPLPTGNPRLSRKVLTFLHRAGQSWLPLPPRCPSHWKPRVKAHLLVAAEDPAFRSEKKDHEASENLLKVKTLSSDKHGSQVFLHLWGGSRGRGCRRRGCSLRAPPPHAPSALQPRPRSSHLPGLPPDPPGTGLHAILPGLEQRDERQDTDSQGSGWGTTAPSCHGHWGGTEVGQGHLPLTHTLPEEQPPGPFPKLLVTEDLKASTLQKSLPKVTASVRFSQLGLNKAPLSSPASSRLQPREERLQKKVKH